MSKNSARNSVQTLKEWITFMKLDKKRKPKKVEFVDDNRNWVMKNAFNYKK